MVTKAVILDFYGTVAQTPDFAPAWHSVMAGYGYEIPDEVRERWWVDALDGAEHHEHSRSRDHYVAWQRARTRAILADCGVATEHHDEIIERVHAIGAHRKLEPYREVFDFLEAVRTHGVRTVLCSNWDWDLHEAIESARLAGRFDAVVSSAWVGVRKPHPRIYEHTLSLARCRAPEALFVGDSWGPDVVGPRAAGIPAAYLDRPGRPADRGRPASLVPDGVPVVSDLREVLPLLGIEGGAGQ